MTVTDVKPGQRSLQVINDERKALQNLIDRRWMWLNLPVSKMKRTYSAVLKDTQEMEARLKELNQEYDEAKITNNENR